MPGMDPRAVRNLVLTVLVAAAGGGLFAWMGLPAAWLTGSMVATVAAVCAGLPVGLPARLRDAAFVLLGISMGSSATPESVAQMQAWPGSIALLGLAVLLTMLAAAVYLERVHGWDRVTARCASIRVPWRSDLSPRGSGRRPGAPRARTRPMPPPRSG